MGGPSRPLVNMVAPTVESTPGKRWYLAYSKAIHWLDRDWVLIGCYPGERVRGKNGLLTVGILMKVQDVCRLP
ncbi:hypothetical protein ES703_25677 [subsurface metagenome]